MSAKHLADWVVSSVNACAAVVTGPPRVCVLTSDSGLIPRSEREQIIARAVACVNFCKGYDNETLEKGPTLSELVSEYARGPDYSIPRDPNAELLAAARNAQCGCTVKERLSGHLVECWMPALTDAIAKAEGRS